jgi:2-dehydro-3-deoxygluconokinase
VADYIASRLSHSTISSALNLAVRAGAAACEHPGDWEGAIRLTDLELDSAADPVQR